MGINLRRTLSNGPWVLLMTLAVGVPRAISLDVLDSISDAIVKAQNTAIPKGKSKVHDELANGKSKVAPTVVLPSNPGGSVKGKWTSPLVRAFLGIPFAAPPTKDLRWRPPQPAAQWTGVKDASSNPPNCLQPLWAEASSPSPGLNELTSSLSHRTYLHACGTTSDHPPMAGTEVVDGKTAAWPSLYPVMSEDCLYLNVFAPPGAR